MLEEERWRLCLEYREPGSEYQLVESPGLAECVMCPQKSMNMQQGRAHAIKTGHNVQISYSVWRKERKNG